MDRLETMQVFVQVAERASFAEAARSLALSPARVTRAVMALEERCGVRLFEYPHTLLHQKVVTVDCVWCAVGSSNFDDRSF